MRRYILLAGILLAGIPAISESQKPGDDPQVVTFAFTDDSARFAPPMVRVAGGEFLMGADLHDPGYNPSEQKHRVVLSPYLIGTHEVTNAQFCEFLNDWGNRTEAGIPWVLTPDAELCPIAEVDGAYIPDPGKENEPVVTVSWRAATAYCDWLASKTGRRFRLPTEAEWEFAARAGTTTTWSWGDVFDQTRLQSRGSTRFNGGLAPVGSYPANPWGLHDTVGNAWEWVVDCVEDDFYARSPVKDPVLYNAQCWTPGIRGGSFLDAEDFCRPGHRINTWWWGEYVAVGFRVAAEETPSRWYRRGRQRTRKDDGKGIE